LTCQKLRRIDFHAHQIRTYNLSEFIDSLVLFQLSSLIPEQILKKIMIVKDGLFGEVKGEEHVRLMEKVRNYEEAWNIQALAERLRRHLTSTPAFFDFLRYLAIIYDCKTLIPEIDDKIGDIHSENAGSYVRSVLDRENIKLALLDLDGAMEVEPPFPPDRFGLLFCPTRSICNPVWAIDHGASSLDEVLELSEGLIKDCIKRKFSGFKSDIAFYRSLEIRRIDEDQVRGAWFLGGETSRNESLGEHAHLRERRGETQFEDISGLHAQVFDGEAPRTLENVPFLSPLI